MREVPHAGPDLPNEVHHYEMKDHVGEDEIRECSLMADSSKLGLVGRIDLNISDVKLWGAGEWEISDLETEADTEDKRGHAGNEAGEKSVEWESSHEAAVDKLDDSGEEDVGEIGVDNLQLLGGARVVLLVEFSNYSSQGRHGWFFFCKQYNLWVEYNNISRSR